MLERRWIMPVTFRGTMIDIETSDLVPSKGEIIIYQKTEPGNYDEFDNTIRSALKILPRPFFAYNASNFEEIWLGVKFDLDLMGKWKRLTKDLNEQKDLLTKWPKLSELISIPYEYYGIKVENSGPEIIGLWKKYIKTRNDALLLRIVYHNRYDLVRECCLLLWDENAIHFIAEIMELGSEIPTIEEEQFNRSASVNKGNESYSRNAKQLD